LTDLYRLLLGVLCVWRITHLFQAEDGPWNMVARIRRAAGDGQFGRLLFAWLIGSTVTERVLLWLAFSGGAILAEQGAMRSRPEPASTVQANYKED
jgi:hypothetical protein